MSALTKKRHTDRAHLCFVGPEAKREQAVEALHALGFVDEGESIPWREAFPEFGENDLPGVSLSGTRTKEGMTQKELAAKTGIPQRHISEMENGKRSIGKESAKKFAEALNADYRIFL